MAVYATRQGDTVDYIAWRHYGSTDTEVVARILDANKGLAGKGPLLPPGLEIILPEIETTIKAQGIRLWD